MRDDPLSQNPAWSFLPLSLSCHVQKKAVRRHLCLNFLTGIAPAYVFIYFWSFFPLHKVIKVVVVVVAVVLGIKSGSDLGGSAQRGLGAALLLGLQGVLGSLLLLVGQGGQGAGVLANIDITDTAGQLADETLQERGIETLFL